MKKTCLFNEVTIKSTFRRTVIFSSAFSYFTTIYVEQTKSRKIAIITLLIICFVAVVNTPQVHHFR